MFERHFGLKANPFAIGPDADFYYPTAAQREALDMIDLALAQGALITLIFGPIGCGKTILTRALVQRLAERRRIGLLGNAYPGLKPVMRWVAGAFDLDASLEDELQCLTAIENLAERQAAAGRPLLLIVDEAQNLSVEALESLRTLTNLSRGKAPLLQLVLLGQPGLPDILRRAELRQLLQRIGAEAELFPMSLPETGDYIAHRLKIAGATGAIFDDYASAGIHHYTRGVPRLVNRLCERALIYAYGAGETEISLPLVTAVARDETNLARLSASA